MAFVDRVEVTFVAGKGGDGLVSFHHEKFRAKGGPDGGDGGDGGNIILSASSNQNTLANFRYKKLIKAEDGQPGRNSKKHGKSGADSILAVPVGTSLTNADGQPLADLVKDGQQHVIARGGKGGFGNAHFTSSRRQTPQVAEKGEPGQKLRANLELKLIADVGIVGLPNAGKSTLLSVISNARPAVAEYPFTTLVPNLGVVDIDNHQSILFADIPGLIEGASQGKGLGDEFLRHIERTSLLLHLIDVYQPDLAAAYRTIVQELRDYKVDLSQKPQVVALTKIEGLDSSDLKQKMSGLKKVLPKDSPLTAISSPSGQGIQELLRTTARELTKIKKQQLKATAKPSLPVIRLEPSAAGWQVTKTKDGSFIVTGQPIERFADRTHFGDYHGEQRLRDIIDKLGIGRELERQGAEPGQPIVIGDPSIGRINF